jgi:hypothetical protein
MLSDKVSVFVCCRDKAGKGLPDGFKQKSQSIFWALEWILLVYFMVNWNILRPFGIYCGHLVYFLPFWYILYQETSGNPG